MAKDYEKVQFFSNFVLTVKYEYIYQLLLICFSRFVEFTIFSWTSADNDLKKVEEPDQVKKTV
jgi:hypothetical protein